jgi:hypothetical protein
VVFLAPDMVVMDFINIDERCVKIKVGLVISVIVIGEEIMVVRASPRVCETHSQSKHFGKIKNMLSNNSLSQLPIFPHLGKSNPTLRV